MASAADRLAEQKAAWAALKKQMQRERISWSKDGMVGYDYYKTCKFVGVIPLPENKEGWVDTRVPHPGKHMRKVFEDIKAHEAKFEAALAEHRKRCAALEQEIAQETSETPAQTALKAAKEALGELLYIRIQQALNGCVEEFLAAGWVGPTITAGKLTGMLLEQSLTEISTWCEDPEELAHAVEEAIKVLLAPRN